MSFVVDNSVALAWCFEDEQTPAVMALLDRVTEAGAMAPQLWPTPALNGLLTAGAGGGSTAPCASDWPASCSSCRAASTRRQPDVDGDGPARGAAPADGL